MASLREAITQLRQKLGLHAVIKDQKELQAQAERRAKAGDSEEEGEEEERSVAERKEEEEARVAASYSGDALAGLHGIRQYRRDVVDEYHGGEMIVAARLHCGKRGGSTCYEQI